MWSGLWSTWEGGKGQNQSLPWRKGADGLSMIILLFYKFLDRALKWMPETNQKEFFKD